MGRRNHLRQTFLLHGFRVERLPNEDDDTDQWLYHNHDDCDIYCLHGEREYSIILMLLMTRMMIVMTTRFS